jgi:hypothetical protein
MPHAFAIDLTPDVTSIPTISVCLPHSSNCRTSIIDGFRIDKHTGEIYGRFITSLLQPMTEQYRSGIPRAAANPSQYLHLIDVRKNDNVVYVDFGGPTPAKPTTVVDVPSSKGKRGPKSKVCLNPFAAIIKVAITENAHWIEDAVMAGMYIAVESSKGKPEHQAGLRTEGHHNGCDFN